MRFTTQYTHTGSTVAQLTKERTVVVNFRWTEMPLPVSDRIKNMSIDRTTDQNATIVLAYAPTMANLEENNEKWQAALSRVQIWDWPPDAEIKDILSYKGENNQHEEMKCAKLNTGTFSNTNYGESLVQEVNNALAQSCKIMKSLAGLASSRLCIIQLHLS